MVLALLVVAVVSWAMTVASRELKQVATLARVSPKLFDSTTCSESSTTPVLTLVSSCPCFLEYVISSIIASTWDVYFIESGRYVEWQRRNFSGEPQYREEYSRLNGRSEGGTTVRLRATNIFESGLFALVVRARTNGTQCFGDISQQAPTKVVFEAMPKKCPIRAREPNVSALPRIVGGSAVNQGNSPNSFGWMALIWEMRGEDMRPICGGAQFENGFVATAAHCLVHLAPQNYRVSLGKRTAEQQGEQLLRISEAYAHPGYETLASHEAVYDVAVLKLEGGGNDVVIELNLESRVPRAGEFVTAAGYGYISEQWTALPVPNRLTRVDVPVVSSFRCERAFEGVNSGIHVCAGYEGGGCDSCQADSGGPLRYVSEGGRERLVGVVSFGAGCARARSAGVYTRVSAVAGWMYEMVQKSRQEEKRRAKLRVVAGATGGGIMAVVVTGMVAIAVARRWRRGKARRNDSSDGSDALSETGVSA